MKVKWTVLSMLLCSCAWAQKKDQQDTVKVLGEITVHAYAANRALKETPVSLGLATEKELARFSNTSILPVVNTIPGVRMEERSPGSYRFSIRGSTIRSPFGVRDVKFYWNGLPLTDGGGNTYLNLLDYDAFGRIEVIKGPGGSLYGAGTGGVVLLTSPLMQQKQLQFTVSGGSFGLQRYQAKAVLGNAKRKFFVNYAHQQSDGYRQQSAMRRDAINVEGRLSLNAKSTLQTSVFYTDLYYQTPGGLTQIQYDTSPSQARPGTTGAVAQKAAIYNRTIYGASVYETQWTSRWSMRAGLYSSYTDYTNPSIRNFERRTEFNLGGRTDTQYEFENNGLKRKFTVGAEWQHFYSPLTDYGNKLGAIDSIQNDDRLTANTFLVFAQADIDLPGNFFLTIGASGNFLRYNFNRLEGAFPGQQKRNFDPVVSPRLALLKKISESLSIYTSVSKGFSVPSLAEVLPSSGIYSNTLAPEQGINYELGIRGKLLKTFSFDVVGYDFELSPAIVSQNGGDYFVNAGSTSQKGLETYVSWQTRQLRAWVAYTLTNYRFVNYLPTNYSGNKWTGTAPNTLVCGLDVSLAQRFYWNLTTTYVDRIPLNDANTAYASDYFLVGSRFGFRNHISTGIATEFFGGVDNAFDQHYSLGNDLNAVGNRFFNTAPTRNFYLGVKIIPAIKN